MEYFFENLPEAFTIIININYNFITVISNNFISLSFIYVLNNYM